VSADAVVALLRMHSPSLDEERLRAELPALEAAFWARADQTGGPDTCWPWTITKRFGKQHTETYGTFPIAGLNMRAHRLAIALSGRTFKRREVGRHRCGNPPCVNPAHLLPGSCSDNVRDFVRMHNRAIGAGKLTIDSARAIRVAFEAGETDMAAIAVRHDVRVAAVRDVLQGKTWRLPEAFPNHPLSTPAGRVSL
jgi:hypothetical protein